MTEQREYELSTGRNSLLNKYDSVDFYHIYEYKGIKYIQIEGYFYYSDDYGDGPWRFEDYSYFELPLNEFIEHVNSDDYENWYDETQCSLKHYVTDMTEHDAEKELEEFFSKGYRNKSYGELSPDTECGNYIDI